MFVNLSIFILQYLQHYAKYNKIVILVFRSIGLLYILMYYIFEGGGIHIKIIYLYHILKLHVAKTPLASKRRCSKY